MKESERKQSEQLRLPWEQIVSDYQQFVQQSLNQSVKEVESPIVGLSQRTLKMICGKDRDDDGLPFWELYLQDVQNPIYHMGVRRDSRGIAEYALVRRNRDGQAHPDLQVREFIMGTDHVFTQSKLPITAVKDEWRQGELYGGIHRQFQQYINQGIPPDQAATMTSTGLVYRDLGFSVKEAGAIQWQEGGSVIVYFTR